MASQTVRGTPGRLAPQREQAACRVDPDAFFPMPYTPKTTVTAKGLCRRCPLRLTCATWVAGHPQDEGVYAAMTPKERDGLAELIAAADGDVALVLRRFDDREALSTAHRIWQHSVTRPEAEQIVGAADLARARRVRAYAPDLVEAVVAGEVSLRDAAAQAAPKPRPKRAGDLPVDAREVAA